VPIGLVEVRLVTADHFLLLNGWPEPPGIAVLGRLADGGDADLDLSVFPHGALCRGGLLESLVGVMNRRPMPR
jgi:hypothetical protein